MLETFEPGIKSLTLIPSNGGVFEVKVNEVLIYSKLQTSRHAEPGEVIALLKKYLEEG